MIKVTFMSASKNFTTIPVKRSTKRLLEIEKGDMTWDDFLLLLLKIRKLQEGKEALNRIRERLVKSERFVIESSIDFRRGLRLKELS